MVNVWVPCSPNLGAIGAVNLRAMWSLVVIMLKRHCSILSCCSVLVPAQLIQKDERRVQTSPGDFVEDVVVVAVAALSMCTRSGVRCVGLNQPSLYWPFDLPLGERSGRAVTNDGAGAKPSRHKSAWKIGRRVAIQAAVIPIPGSTVDHMETSITTSMLRISS
jgi:hypothetical protein